MKTPLTRIAPLVLVTALALAACDNNDATTTGNVENVENGYMQDTNVAMTDDDMMSAVATPDFIGRMAMSDMYEIEAGKIALQRSMSPQIKKFAQMMVTDHGASSAELKKLVADGKLAAPPAALDDEHNDKLKALRDADKDDFDGTYADQQRDAHEQAITLLEGYAAGGDNGGLKTFAQNLLPKVRGHLEQIKTLDKAGADEAPQDR